MTSIKYLEREISTWLSTHPSKPKYFFEFTEQMPNLATISEIYPLVFFAYDSSTSSMNVVTHTFNVHCVDLIRDKRDNIKDVMSEMQMMLNDVFMHFQNSHPFIDSIGGLNSLPINNFDLDYVAGWVGLITFELPQICDNLV